MERTSSKNPKARTQVGLSIKGNKISTSLENRARKTSLDSQTGLTNVRSKDQPNTRKCTTTQATPVKRKQTSARRMTKQEHETLVVKETSSENPKALQAKVKLSGGEKRKGPTRSRPSSLSPSHRRNGQSEVPIFLRPSPASSSLSPEPSKKQTPSPNSRRKAFFGKDTKGGVKESKDRRDAVSNTTDDFAKERMAVRVLWKKF